MNEAAIIHELTIFDKRCIRFMNKSDTIRSWTLKISLTTKKKNKRSSRRSLKTKMKDLLQHRVHINFDLSRKYRQKAFAVAQSIKKNRKFTIDLNSNRENWFHRFFVQTKNLRNNVDFVSMRLKQSNDSTRNYVLRINKLQKFNVKHR